MLTATYAVVVVGIVVGPGVLLELGPGYRWNLLTTIAALLWGALFVAGTWLSVRRPAVRTLPGHVIACVLAIVGAISIHATLAFAGGPPMGPVYLAAATVCIGPWLAPRRLRAVGVVISAALFSAVVHFWNLTFGQSPNVWW